MARKIFGCRKRVKIQQCETDQKATSHSEVTSVFPSLPDYLLYALLASGALITAALLFIIICIRIRNDSAEKNASRMPSWLGQIIITCRNLHLLNTNLVT
uniref:Uncharacterized protein n=1 Tax=Onchocerca volvulus TaxID=6282 RepID=A0A8R1Y082_ONCVO